MVRLDRCRGARVWRVASGPGSRTECENEQCYCDCGDHDDEHSVERETASRRCAGCLRL